MNIVIRWAKNFWHGFTKFACRHKTAALFRALDRLAVRYHSDFENQNYEMESNGERRVLELLRVIGPKCLFDVGANAGDWSVIANSLYPSANIYDFEIATPTYEGLKLRINGITNIVAHNFGLGARNGEIEINYSPDHTGVSTAINLDFRYGKTTIRTEKLKARIVQGDVFLSQNAISRIDFLKLDVEGMEHEVLEGFRDALETGRIACVQFEYGMINIATKFLLADFYKLFQNLGYVVGKIYPTYVDYSQYDYTRENFIGGNYIAVRKTESDLISAFQGSRRRCVP